MSANTFGRHFQITSFGESHGAALGVVIGGCPAGVQFDEPLLLNWLERRRPGASAVTSSRQELDRPEVLSGIFEGRTLGTPICIVVRNTDARSVDYETIKNTPRAGHADDVWRDKFGLSDHRGGGRSSGRETLARVIGGAFAQMFLQSTKKNIVTEVLPILIGPVVVSDYEKQKNEIDNFLAGVKAEGDSVGGIVEVRIQNPPQGLGQPVFHKLKSDFAAAFMSIGAVTGVDLGGGFKLAEMRGTDVHMAVSKPTDVYGGIRGGISTGEQIIMHVAFKPTSSILDVAKKGRHDPCIVLRALPVVEAMTHLVLADHILWSRLDRL